MTDAPLFDRHMLEALVCPVTHATLSYDAQAQELVSRTAGLAFPFGHPDHADRRGPPDPRR